MSALEEDLSMKLSNARAKIAELERKLELTSFAPRKLADRVSYLEKRIAQINGRVREHIRKNHPDAFERVLLQEAGKL